MPWSLLYEDSSPAWGPQWQTRTGRSEQVKHKPKLTKKEKKAKKLAKKES